MTRTRHLVKQGFVASVLLVFICALAGLLSVRSGWFREQVRQRIIAEVENATGGRVEVGNFSFKWETLVATVSPFILHGTEAPSDPPLLRVESVSLGLRIISMLERKVDLASLRVDQPRLRVVIYADGSDNLPTPKGVRNGKDWAQNLVDLAVQRYQVTRGTAEVDVRQVPLNFSGEDLRLQMRRDASRPRYQGEVSSNRLRISSAITAPVEMNMSAKFSLDGARLNLSPLRLTSGKSIVDLNGYLTELQRPRGVFKAKATVALSDAVPLFSLPVAPAGTASFDGDLSLSFADGFTYALSGRAAARGLGYAQGRLKIDDADVNALLRASPGEVRLRGLTAHALGAEITGQTDLIHNHDFHFAGNVSGLTVREAASMVTARPIPWDGILSTAIQADAVIGQTGAKLQATGTIAANGAGTPIQGQFDVFYDQRAGTVAFGDSRVNTAATTLAISGTLGQTLDVRARTTDLNDVVTALSLASAGAPRTLPLTLIRGRGEASAVGTVAGPLTDPEFRGQISLTSASIAGHAFDRLASDVQANRRSVALRRLALARGATQIAGDATIAANPSTSGSGDFMTGPLTARLSVKDLSLAEAAHEWNFAAAVAGMASGTVRLSGTASAPVADIDLDATQVRAAGEQIDRLRTNLRYTSRALAFNNAQANFGAGRVLFSGTYDHPENDYTNGAGNIELTAQGLMASRIAALRSVIGDSDGRLDGKATVQGQLDHGNFDVHSLTGDVTARAITTGNEKLGDVTLSAKTTGSELALRAKAQVLDTEIDGEGQWRLEGDLPGSAALHFPRLTVGALHDLVMLRGTAPEKATVPPFDGFLRGNATVTVALRKPMDFRAEVKIDTLQLNARPGQTLRLDVQAQDVQIRNSQPIVFAVTAKEARIATAHFAARGTDLDATGVVPFKSVGGADLAVKGTVNLGILQLLNADLLARGTANVNASVRGSLRDPQVTGRMEFNGASLYMNDVPNGIDSASGAVLFDRNRATIEKLTAETGGGQIEVRGFLDFGSTLVYRLQAEGRQVRVRYPEDVSLTADAQLALTGTSEASTLSGTVTLNRAAISANVDLGKLLALAAKPSPAAPNPNEYLRGMRFDVRIGNAPTFGLETSLTRNVQSEVDLRLRGTPLTPTLLGTIAVNSGEIQVFGNRYTVNRGDIRFLNPVKIEPTFDVDLETRTSGITVNVTLAGTAEHLNVNYSSDPPLQSREIIALLAVGRDPTALSSAAQFSSSTAGFSDAGGLLGEAVSQQLSNRLQRFFGASRVKIDPTLTGVDNLPAARLTVEQQVSRDVTLTYITNLNHTQEQIVRVEWEFSQHWSAIALRNSNGLFGIDVQYRKRFK
jgi:translocation and assembly module TamB